MKKIFTLFTSALVASSAMAQAVALDANRIAAFYKTYDGTAFENLPGENGWEGTKSNTVALWRLAVDDQGRKNYTQIFPISLDGIPNDMNDITLTKDYTDPETGFSVPAGRYTTLCNNDYISSDFTRKTIKFSDKTSDGNPIKNIRKFIVYVAGIGASKANDGTLYQDGIRINGTKIYNGDNVFSNEVSGTDGCTTSWLTRYVYNGVITSADNVDVYNPETKVISSNTYTQDKLFRVVIDFKTPHDPDDAHDGYDHNGTDNVSNNVGDGSPEQDIDRACIDKETGKATCDERVYNVCHKFEDPDGDGTTGKGGKPGYYSYDWTWSKEIGQMLEIKKSYNIFAIALICGDDDAKTYISYVNDKKASKWTEVEAVVDAISNINAETKTVAPAKTIENGRIVISKSGRKFNVAGAQIN